jgi:hypothetical protein
MKTLLLAALILLSACTTIPKRSVVYSSHYTNSYTTAILNKCRSEADLLAFFIAEGKIARNEPITETDVTQMRKYLMDSCVKYYKIDV